MEPAHARRTEQQHAERPVDHGPRPTAFSLALTVMVAMSSTGRAQPCHPGAQRSAPAAALASRGNGLPASPPLLSIAFASTYAVCASDPWTPVSAEPRNVVANRPLQLTAATLARISEATTPMLRESSGSSMGGSG